MYGHKLDFVSGAYVDKDGFMAVGELPSSQLLGILDAAYGNYRRRDSTTSISATYDGNQGSGILKVQWKNMAINGYPDNYFVNFQIWFDQSDIAISFHYGPLGNASNIDPVIGLIRTGNSTDTLAYSTFLRGDGAQPSGLSVYYSRKLPVFPVSGFPPDGTVYTFKRNSTILEKGNKALMSEISISPNPAKDMLMISNIFPSDLKVFDLSGKQLMHIDSAVEIDVRALIPGIYMVLIDNMVSMKFIRE